MKKMIAIALLGVAVLMALYHFSSCLVKTVKKKAAPPAPPTSAVLRPVKRPVGKTVPTTPPSAPSATKKTPAGRSPSSRTERIDGKNAENAEGVRVAALQCWTEMTKTEKNAKLLETLVRAAAKNGAKIVVTPECALQGYCHPSDWLAWTTDPEDKDCPHIADYAETIPGKHTKRFAELAKELGIYICLGMAERSGEKFYNSQALLGPDGTVVAVHRKSRLWTPGDGWCEPGPEKPVVVDSPYGKLGLMICFEVHSMPEKLAKAGTDIVLYSVGWYGPNEREWFGRRFPRDVVKKYNLAVVLANWSGPGGGDSWPGLGFSSIYDSSGKILAASGAQPGPRIAIATLPAPGKKKKDARGKR